jgi:hypothetical protein
MQTPNWFKLAAAIRPYVNQIPGLDGEFLGYLVDRVSARNGADTDEYRALQSYAVEARKLAKGKI